MGTSCGESTVHVNTFLPPVKFLSLKSFSMHLCCYFVPRLLRREYGLPRFCFLSFFCQNYCCCCCRFWCRRCRSRTDLARNLTSAEFSSLISNVEQRALSRWMLNNLTGTNKLQTSFVFRSKYSLLSRTSYQFAYPRDRYESYV